MTTYKAELKKLDDMRANAKSIKDFSSVNDWLNYNSQYAKDFAAQVERIKIAGK